MFKQTDSFSSYFSPRRTNFQALERASTAILDIHFSLFFSQQEQETKQNNRISKSRTERIIAKTLVERSL